MVMKRATIDPTGKKNHQLPSSKVNENRLDTWINLRKDVYIKSFLFKFSYRWM